MEIGSPNPFSDMSYSGPNIQVSHNWVKLEFKHWELRPHWVSTVHGWAGVAGHLAESLNRICLSRYLLCSSSSFDRAWACRSYFRISKHRSKHTTSSISSSVRYKLAWSVQLWCGCTRRTSSNGHVDTELTVEDVVAVAFISRSSIDSYTSRGPVGWAVCT
jgi:hypothetical protein